MSKASDAVADSVGFGANDVTRGLWHSLFKSGMVIVGADKDGREWGHHGRFVVAATGETEIVLRGECTEWTPVESLRKAVNWFAMYARGYGYTAHVAEDHVTVTLSRSVVGPVLST